MCVRTLLLLLWLLIAPLEILPPTCEVPLLLHALALYVPRRWLRPTRASWSRRCAAVRHRSRSIPRLLHHLFQHPDEMHAYPLCLMRQVVVKQDVSLGGEARAQRESLTKRDANGACRQARGRFFNGCATRTDEIRRVRIDVGV